MGARHRAMENVIAHHGTGGRRPCRPTGVELFA
jgi:hypothetical protein